MRRYHRITSDEADILGFCFGVVMFAVLFILCWTYSFDEWHSEIKYQRHNPNWYQVDARVSSLDPINISSTNPHYRTAVLTYFDRLAVKRTTAVNVAYKKSITLNTHFKLTVNKSGNEAYLPKYGEENVENPFKKYRQDSFFPLLCIVLVGGIANAIISFVLCGGFASLMHGKQIIIPNRRYESLFGMRKVPKPKKYKLIHTPDGRLIEVEIK